jgi:hypothetical protein
MAAWFHKSPADKDPSGKENEGFSLRIETHPDTHLLQTLQLNDSDSIQILQLGKYYYALKKTKYQRTPALLIQDAGLCERIRKQQLLPSHLEHLFPVIPAPPTAQHLDILIDDQGPAITLPLKGSTPPATNERPTKNLTNKLKEAMAEFMENNPDTATALNLKSAGTELKTKKNSISAFEPAFSAYSQHGSLGENIAKHPLNQLTQAAVFTALQQASENQQAHLEKAQDLKRELESNSQKLHVLLNNLPNLESQFQTLSQQLEKLNQRWDPSESLKPEDLLQKTGKELAQLQKQLEKALPEALSLQNLLEIYAPRDSQRFDGPLTDLKDLIQAIVAQRHQVNYYLQQQAFKELEQLRLSHLQQRQAELENAIDELSNSIQQLDTINQEILSQDPLAVPEPIPALALHELSRLEAELHHVLADPALRLNPISSRES